MSKSRSKMFHVVCLAALSAAAFGASPAHSKEEVKVGINGVASDAAFFIAQDKGFFAEQGLDVTFIKFDVGPTMVAPLASGQLDVGGGATSAGLFNSVARGLNIRAVADKGSMPEGYEYNPMLVRKELYDSGKLKTYADLKGFRVAQSGKGGASGALVNKALTNGGLSYGDVTHVHITHVQMITSFTTAAIDAAAVAEPFATQAMETGSAVRLSRGDLSANHQVAVLLFGGKFANERKEAAKKFMVAYLKASRIYNDALKGGKFAGSTADYIVNLLAKNTSAGIETYRKITPNGLNPNGEVNLETMTRDLEFFKKQGYIEGNVTVDMAVDTSFSKAAVEILGPYKRAD